MTIDVAAVAVVGAIAMLIGQLVFSRIGEALKRKASADEETREQVIRMQERMSQPGPAQAAPTVDAMLLNRLDGLVAQVTQLSTTLARIEGTVQADMRHHAARIDNLEKRETITIRELTTTLDAALAPVTARVAALERKP
jgi:type II secretory pathway pseudopilin PulG